MSPAQLSQILNTDQILHTQTAPHSAQSETYLPVKGQLRQLRKNGLVAVREIWLLPKKQNKKAEVKSKPNIVPKNCESSVNEVLKINQNSLSVFDPDAAGAKSKPSSSLDFSSEKVLILSLAVGLTLIGQTLLKPQH